MAHQSYPITPAVRFLKSKGIDFIPHLYTYEEHGGTKASAGALKVDEHSVIKTLVMETAERWPLLVLMHGDCEVSTKQLARFIGTKHVTPCDSKSAERSTGYQFGGTSPFGTRTPLPVYAESSVFSLPKIYINGGKRGFLIELVPAALLRCLSITQVRVAVSASR